MNVGARGTGSNQHEVRSKAATAPTLALLGITKDQSSRYQSGADTLVTIWTAWWVPVSTRAWGWPGSVFITV